MGHRHDRIGIPGSRPRLGTQARASLLAANMHGVAVPGARVLVDGALGLTPTQTVAAARDASPPTSSTAPARWSRDEPYPSA